MWGQRWRNGMRLTGGSLREERSSERVVPFGGLHVYVGPLGAGKTLLTVAHSHWWAGKRCEGDGRMGCGVKDCEARWEVYTNLDSTEAWAKKIDVVEDLRAGAIAYKHAILVLDEAGQLADSRRSQRSENLEIAYWATMLRKKHVKVRLTVQSFNMLDSRLRDLSARVYNCWTRNGGKTVNALVYEMSNGSMAPWERETMRPKMRWWYTAWARDLYNTHEIVDLSGDFAAARQSHYVHVVQTDPQGNRVVVRISHEEVVAQVTTRLAQDGMGTVAPEWLHEHILGNWNIDIPAPRINRILAEEGYDRNADGKFVILAGMAG